MEAFSDYMMKKKFAFALRMSFPYAVVTHQYTYTVTLILAQFKHNAMSILIQDHWIYIPGILTETL